MLVALFVLAACGTEPAEDVPEDRQFANDPVPTQMATEVPTDAPTQAPETSQPTAQDATPEVLLRTRGAPSTLYTVSGGDLVVLTFRDGDVDETPVLLPDGAEVLGFDASPTGDRVGVLLSIGQGSPFVQFFNDAGELIGGPFGPDMTATPQASPGAPPVASPVATPENAEVERGPVSVTWIPQGNGVMAVYDGTVTTVDIELGAEPVDVAGVEGEAVYAAASPKGSGVLVQTVLDDGSQAAYLIQPSSGELHELRALRTGQGVGISELDWLPSGNGVVFVEGEIHGGVVMRGQLFSYLFQNEVPHLVATSGQGGPSATITNVSISPDGYSVAYDVSIYDLNEWVAHSLWVRSLREDVPGVQVAVDPGQPITRIEWSRDGLFWAQQVGDENMTLNVVTASGEITQFGQPEPEIATPVASPVISATPVSGQSTPSGATPIVEMTPVG